MAGLTTDIKFIKGIGEKKAQSLNKLGVFSLYDLISFFPRRYEDRTKYKPIALLSDGESACIRAMIADVPRLTRIRRGLDLVRFRAVDDSGSAEITYFNQSYLKDSFHRGEIYCFYGKAEVKGKRVTFTNPVHEPEDAMGGVTGRIMPVYRVCKGLSQKDLLKSIRAGLNECGEQLPEILPETVRTRAKLCQARYAYESIHSPGSFEALALARRRLVFEELFILACALGTMRNTRVKETGLCFSEQSIEDFISSLPFVPTGAQLRAYHEAVRDMTGGNIMNRLIQGDVGSGKTLVAAMMILQTVRNGYSAAFMAPTEILAAQHYNTLCSLLCPFGLHIGILTGSSTAKEKRKLKEQLSSGEIDLVVGTHALFSADVIYDRLGLVVTDEQHRFGVNQRAALIGKGVKPHVAVMSATPIPRTLALIMYGDLDVSVLDELPPGRQKIDTFTVDESYRDRLNGFIRKLASEGRQVFVVCPKVEEDGEKEDNSNLKSAEEHAAELQLAFPGLTVACVHGKLKAAAKDAVMRAFADGSVDILVATTVIEVGVDVPNAVLMVIENAERFGLSQLHQLRGRVGRGSHKSYCVLVSDSDTEEAKARLSVLCKTNDGFKVSEEDLRLRGPGDFFGQRQHGLPEMHVADLGTDINVLKEAQNEAQMLLAGDPELSGPECRLLRERIEFLFSRASDSFN